MDPLIEPGNCGATPGSSCAVSVSAVSVPGCSASVWSMRTSYSRRCAQSGKAEHSGAAAITKRYRPEIAELVAGATETSIDAFTTT